MSQAVDERGMKLWQCIDCGYARERKSDVTKHVERRHIEMQVSCDLCHAIFSSRTSLKDHVKYKHWLKLQCFNCLFLIVGTEENILSCMMKNEQGWNCLSCGWITKNKTRLFEHVEAKHVPSAGYNCPFCEKFFRSLNSLKVHKSNFHRNM